MVSSSFTWTFKILAKYDLRMHYRCQSLTLCLKMWSGASCSPSRIDLVDTTKFIWHLRMKKKWFSTRPLESITIW